jgi:hypothetical protein
MAFVLVEGCRLAYWVDGPEHAQTVLLSNPIGATVELWDK